MSKVEFVNKVFLTKSNGCVSKVALWCIFCFWVFDLFLDFILLIHTLFILYMVMKDGSGRRLVLVFIWSPCQSRDSDHTSHLSHILHQGILMSENFTHWGQLWQICRWLDGNAAPCRQSKDGRWKTARRRGTEAKSKKRVNARKPREPSWVQQSPPLRSPVFSPIFCTNTLTLLPLQSGALFFFFFFFFIGPPFGQEGRLMY